MPKRQMLVGVLLSALLSATLAAGASAQPLFVQSPTPGISAAGFQPGSNLGTPAQSQPGATADHVQLTQPALAAPASQAATADHAADSLTQVTSLLKLVAPIISVLRVPLQIGAMLVLLIAYIAFYRNRTLRARLEAATAVQTPADEFGAAPNTDQAGRRKV